MKRVTLSIVAMSMAIICLSFVSTAMAQSDCPECDVVANARAALNSTDGYETPTVTTTTQVLVPTADSATNRQTFGSNGGSSGYSSSYGSNGGNSVVRMRVIRRQAAQTFGSNGGATSGASSGYSSQPQFQVRQGLFGRTVIRPIR